jgi:soluble cytochrome b562
MADTNQELSDNRSINEIIKSNLALKKQINEERAKELALIKKQNQANGVLEQDDKDRLKASKERQTSLNTELKIQQELIKTQRAAIQEQVTQYANVESSIGSISSAMGSLKDNLIAATKLGINFSNTMANGSESSKDSMRQASIAGAQAISAITSLSALNKEDSAQRAEYTQEYRSQYAIMAEQLSELESLREDGRTRQGKATKQSIAELQIQMSLLDEAFEKADKFSNVQKDIKELYEEMHEELGAGNKIIQKGINYAKIFFGSVSGAMTVIGFAVGYLLDEFGKINAQIGGGFTNLVGFKSQLTAISLILGDEAVGAVTEFGARIGDVNTISNSLALDLSLLPNHLGVSGEEAGKLVNQFGNLQGLSAELALNSLEATSQLAAANGVAPSQVMKDVAQNTEFFAKYSKDGGKNISEAAIQAAKLGVDLSTAAEISDGLLDYQTSVAAEMEASVILGRNLNLQRARELAFQGKGAEAMKEAIKSAGTLAELEAMNPIEREALAKAIGTTSDKLRQMIANEKEALKPVDGMTSSFNTISAAVDQIGTTGLGKWAGGLTGFITSLGQIGMGLNQIGINLGDLSKKTFTWIGNLFKAKAAQDSVTASTTASSMAGPLAQARDSKGRFTSNKSIAPKMDTSGVDKTSKSVGGAGSNASAMLKGAAALLIAAAAIYVLGLALQQFTKIGANEIISLAGALVVVGLALAAFGTFAAPIMLGAVALGFASIALGMFGAALMIVGNGLSSISSPFGMITANLSTLASLDVTPIYSMATALTTLAYSLALVAASGGLALPILSGLNELGIAAAPIGGTATNTTQTTTGGSTDLSGLITEVKNLTNAIKAEALIVNIEGREIARGMRKYLKNT